MAKKAKNGEKAIQILPKFAFGSSGLIIILCI